MLLKLYNDVYVHPPPNGDYLTIFLHGWLAHHKGHKLNWSLYAHDYIVQQMKKKHDLPLHLLAIAVYQVPNQSHYWQTQVVIKGML